MNLEELAAALSMPDAELCGPDCGMCPFYTFELRPGIRGFIWKLWELGKSYWNCEAIADIPGKSPEYVFTSTDGEHAAQSDDLVMVMALLHAQADELEARRKM